MDTEQMLNPAFFFTLFGTMLFSYLLGSLNCAVIVSRVFAGDDVRNHGSGNAGMTNMLRTYGKKLAFLTGVGDFAKGSVAVLVSRWAFSSIGVTAFDGGYIGMIFVMLGHLFPVFFGFKGGKGVLTACGGILVVNPIAFSILFVCFVPIAFITRIVSLASVLGTASFPFLTYFIRLMEGKPPVIDTIFGTVAALLIIYMHKENIKRLLNGTESRIGSSKKERQSHQEGE